MDRWSEQETAALQLHLTPGVGPRLQQVLQEHLGDPPAVLRASEAQLLAVPGIGKKLARRIVESDRTAIEREIRQCEAHDIAISLRGSSEFPAMLEHIVDPPGALFVRGAMAAQDALAVGMVGSRHATRYGLQQAERLAGSLSKAGLTIVSGLARGVDAAAHRGALAAGGRTIAVLACGVLRVYPPEHDKLAGEIACYGALISEAPPFRKPMSGAFPQRNRLISGVSLGVIVVEAAERSGALITARHAMEQGREVFAIPGRIDNRMSKGCHQLLRDGAKLVENVDDVLEELCPLVSPVKLESDGGEVRYARELTLDEQERTVLDLIEDEPTHIDIVGSRCGLSMPQLLATVSVLEARRLVQRVGGGTFIRI